jgi:isoleucyl-tRNA synthetase
LSENIISKTITSFDSLEDDMNILRDMVTMGLEARVSTGFKVRQPLRKITFTGDRFKNIFKEEQLKEILLEELNIKEIEFEKGEDEKVLLDTELDDELIEEGNYREFLRLVQSMRKNAGLKVEDIIELKIDILEDKKSFIENNLEDLEKIAGVKNINYSGIEGGEDSKKVNEIEFKMVLIK